MLISLSTGTLYTLPLTRAASIAMQAGYDGVELIINQDFQRVNCRQLIEEVAAIAPIHSIHSPFMPLDGWGGPIDSLKRSVELAAACAVPLVNFHPPSWMDVELGFWRWLYRINDFQAEIGDGSVVITLENMPWVGKFKINPHILSNTEKMIEFIQERNLYLTFDTTHMGSGKANFINDFYLCYNSGRIRNIHFSDYGYGREHLIPGHGILPLTRFLNHLRSTAFNHSLTVELSPHEFPRDEELILESLSEILSYLRKETCHVPTETDETVSPHPRTT